jgi:transcriptional regulator with XRE-family HTH domain
MNGKELRTEMVNADIGIDQLATLMNVRPRLVGIWANGFDRPTLKQAAELRRIFGRDLDSLARDGANNGYAPIVDPLTGDKIGEVEL